MRAREIISEIRDVPQVPKLYPGDIENGLTGSGASSRDRKARNQIFLGKYKKYNVWTHDLRQEGDTSYYYDIEVTTPRRPYTVGLNLELKPTTMYIKKQKQDVEGHRVSYVVKMPDGPGSEIDVVDFYIWVMNTLGTTLISDSRQSKGGASIWKRLAGDPRVDVFGYSPITLGISQVDSEGDADLWDTWAGSDKEIVDQANSARKSAWGTIDIDKAIWQVHKDWHDGVITKEEAKQKQEKIRAQELAIRKEADDARQKITDEGHHILFAVPSNKSKHT